MPFPYDKYPWLNFQELNLAYFIKHFREIFQQWDELYHDLTEWKEATDEELAEWKTATEAGLESWKTGLTESLETWKSQTATDISGWETATLAALDAWKTATTAVFEEIRTEAAGSASAAAASASAADTARAAAASAQSAAEQAAAGISAELAQIQTNTADIADLKSAIMPVVDTVAMLRQTTYPVGTFIETRGFNTAFDYGDALYCVHSSEESYTVNNVTIFKDANNNYIVRVFDKPYIYLESLNVENVAWNVIDNIIVQSGIKDVRANILHMDHSISISQYDFTFNEIHSSGDPALKLYDANTCKIVGKAIYATYRGSATGFLVQNTDSNIMKNYIDIRRIEATGICALIRPTNGHGILENEYHFGVLQGRKYNAVASNPIYGVSISIAAVKSNNEYVLDNNGYPLYSYEGEDQYWIDIISVKNDSRNGAGVNINLAISDRNFSDSTIDTNTSVFGTVTGLTFHNLSVEECDIGVRMRCGTGNPAKSLRTQSGIKSVRINNMRVREDSVRYFDLAGWFRDIYIQPTSKINLSQVGTAVPAGNVAGIGYNAENDNYKFPIINASQEYVIIDAPVFNGNFDGAYSGHYGDGIGEQLIAANNQTYIGKRIPLEIAVTSQESIEDSTISPAIVEYDTVENEYVLRRFFENHFPCAERFTILDDLSGNAETPKTVVLDLREYYYQNSAVGIKVSVPAYCVCYIRLITGNKMKVCNANAVRKNYTFSQLYSRTSILTAKPYIVEESIVVT